MAETKKGNKKLETNIPKKRKTKFTCKRCGNKYPSEIAEKINGDKYCPHCYNFLKEDEVFERKIRIFLNDMVNTNPHSQKNAGDSLLAAVKRQEFTLRGVYYTLEYLKGDEEIWNQITPSNVYFKVKDYYGIAKKEYKERRDAEKDAEAHPNRKPEKVTYYITRSTLDEQNMRYVEAQKTAIYGRDAIDLDEEIDLNEIEEDEEGDLINE